MSSEDRAFEQVSAILSGLDPAAAARVARRVWVAHGRSLAGPSAPAAEAPASAEDSGDASPDERPSFLQTQVRMKLGKELLEQLATEDDGPRS